MDLVTIAVAVYNGAPYIKRCLDSVLSQDYRNIDVIIVDDGSTDNSLDIIKEYCNKDSRFRYISHHKNLGLPVARNTGIKAAKGNYISMIDIDDYLEKNYICTLLDALKRNNVQLCACHHITHWVSNPSKIKYFQENNIERLINSSDFDYLDETLPYTVWSLLIKKELLDGIEFDADLLVGQDTPFIAQVIKKAGKFLVLNRNLYHYFIYAESSCHGIFKRDKITALKSWKRTINTYNDLPQVQLTVKAKYATQCLIFIRKYFFNMGVSHKIYKMVLKEYRNYIKYMIFYAIKKPGTTTICNALFCVVFAMFPFLYPKYYLLRYHEKS